MRSASRYTPPVLKHQLSPSDKRFVSEYLIDLSPRNAAARAGLDRNAGGYLLARRTIQDEIARVRGERSDRPKVYADEVLRQYWLTAGTDARELVEIRRVNCRCCWGIDHLTQYTPNEMRARIREHRKEMLKLPEPNRVPFDEEGGTGFNRWRDPNPECPECGGHGEPVVWIEDSRNYSPGAAALFDGVKVGRDGSIEVKLRNRDQALDRVAQHLSLFVKPQVITTLDPTLMTDDQLQAMIEQFERMCEQEQSAPEHEDSVT